VTMAPTWSIVDYCAGLVRLQVVWPQQSNPHTLELVSEERDRTARVQGGCTPPVVLRALHGASGFVVPVVPRSHSLLPYDDDPKLEYRH